MQSCRPSAIDDHGIAFVRTTMGALLSSLLEIFYTKKLDIVVIGLENRWVIEETPEIE